MNKPLILIVEDDKAVRNLMGTTLDIQEYRYHMAKNGAQALMEAVSQRPDVIILDLGLPDMDGVELIKNDKILVKCTYYSGKCQKRGCG